MAGSPARVRTATAGAPGRTPPGRGRPALALAAILLALIPAAAAATDAAYGYGPRQPPLSLPQTLRATIRVPLHRAGTGETPRPAEAIDTLRDLYPALAACWRPPEGLAGLERTEITTRFALRRDGSLMGTPRVTFATLPPDSRARSVLAEATVAALRACTPVRITPALGGAVAGRPLALRFVYEGPRGRPA